VFPHTSARTRRQRFFITMQSLRVPWHAKPV